MPGFKKDGRRSWRHFPCCVLSGNAQVVLHHRSDVCRYGGGLGIHVTRNGRVGYVRQMLSMRQRRGVTPVRRVNVLVKWLWSAKPHASEIICRGMDDVRMYIMARSMR